MIKSQKNRIGKEKKIPKFFRNPSIRNGLGTYLGQAFAGSDLVGVREENPRLAGVQP
jgi:hypothetical protein